MDVWVKCLFLCRAKCGQFERRKLRNISFTLIIVPDHYVSVPCAITKVTDLRAPNASLSHTLLLRILFCPALWLKHRGPGPPNISFKLTFPWEPFLHSDTEHSPPPWRIQRRPASPNSSFELAFPVELFTQS